MTVRPGTVADTVERNIRTVAEWLGIQEERRAIQETLPGGMSQRRPHVVEEATVAGERGAQSGALLGGDPAGFGLLAHL
ncbi:hypothetical protein AMK29_20235 [Streptomyces sp. CB02261]|nr:hypothetical protein AMK29_20235 [Streptomyces sp. CB02261]